MDPPALAALGPDDNERGHPALSRDHLCQQPPVALDRLAHREPQLHLPAACRHRVHDWHAKILLQKIDDRQHAPAGAEKIDRVGLAMLEEGPFDMGVDLLGGELADLVESDLDALHAEDVEARLDKIVRKQVVDAAAEIGRAQDLPGPERAQRAHVVRARGEERSLILPLPSLQQLGLALEAEQHEWRRALWMDQVTARVRELLVQGLLER